MLNGLHDSFDFSLGEVSPVYLHGLGVCTTAIGQNVSLLTPLRRWALPGVPCWSSENGWTSSGLKFSTHSILHNLLALSVMQWLWIRGESDDGVSVAELWLLDCSVREIW